MPGEKPRLLVNPIRDLGARDFRRRFIDGHRLSIRASKFKRHAQTRLGVLEQQLSAMQFGHGGDQRQA